MPIVNFDKILIANRGEIALRIMRTLQSMGIKSAAVYSEADTDALHVQKADEAYYVGHSPANLSYLSIPNIISAVRASGAQAVHPGYGFLSENFAFASALKKEGVKLIGPNAKVIKQMGDKIEAKKIAIEAGVSTVPGYVGTIKSEFEALEIARQIGFPIIVKAAAGGGGRGMRIVHNDDQMKDAYISAQMEAENSFSDSRVFIEKLIERPRHIEIQVLADDYGNVLCLGERECSIQRHHQKIIEEAPSAFIDEELRQKMYAQVRALIKKVGYSSAGTVEFIFDQDRNFYFLEMNTRLQVEHTVTELITGIDIVKEMIKIAGGHKLAITQDDVQLKGWAKECRIYAEDPSRGFLPSSGRIREYIEPPKNEFTRIDSGIDIGSEVSMFYDPMVAKLCSYGSTRLEAIENMKTALSRYVISGISHNMRFLEALLNTERYVAGDINTNFIQEEYPDGFAGANLTSETNMVFVAAVIFIFITEQDRASKIKDDGYHKSVEIGTRWVVNLEDKFFPVVIKSVAKGFKIRQGSQRIDVISNWRLGSKIFSGAVNGKSVNVKIETTGSGYWLTYSGVKVKAFVRSPRRSELEAIVAKKPKGVSGNTELLAPLSGQINAIKVAVGDKVIKGQELISLVAMKMENIILAEFDGEIEKISVAAQDCVHTGQLLIEFK